MDEKRTSGAWIGAALLMVLLVLYVGSYLALVRPGLPGSVAVNSRGWYVLPSPKYRYGGNYAETIFWPLEQVHRKARPTAWDVSP